jgi:nucleotide-binding universal stress UspA family protein
MTTIILPVDFSAASMNAVRYAADMSCDRLVGRIILLHAVRASVYSNMTIAGNGEAFMEERGKDEQLLLERSRELMADCSSAAKVQTAMSEMPVLRAVHQLIHDVEASMVVIGVDGSSEAGFISEHVIELARTSAVPVLVVPNGCRYVRPRVALLVSRMGQDALDAVSVEWLRDEFDEPVLEGFAVGGPDVVKAVLDRMEEVKAQLIVALPGQKSLFYRLTHRGIRKAIARNARYPVLLLK